MVRRQRGARRPAARLGSAARGARLHHLGRAARLHLGHARLRVLRRRRPAFAAPGVPAVRARGRGRQRRHPRRGRQPRAAPRAALRDGLLPRRHLPGRHEDRLGLVPARPRQRAGVPRRRPRRRHGVSAPAARPRPGAALAGRARRRLRGRGRGRAAHVRPRAGRAASLPGREVRSARARRGVPRARVPRLRLRLFRAHVGAVRLLGVRALDSRGARRGAGIAVELRGDRHRHAGLHRGRARVAAPGQRAGGFRAALGLGAVLPRLAAPLLRPGASVPRLFAILGRGGGRRFAPVLGPQRAERAARARRLRAHHRELHRLRHHDPRAIAPQWLFLLLAPGPAFGLLALRPLLRRAA